MNDFLNVPNPDEKINNILKGAIKTRQTDIEKLNSQIDSIKKQETDGKIFAPLSKDPEDHLTPEYVASAVATLIGDTLTGFYEGVQKIKEDTDATNVGQRGGKSEDDKDKTDKNKTNKPSADKDEKKQLSAKSDKPSADNIKDQADKLAQLMEKAAQKATQIANEATQKINSSSSSLGVDNRTALQDSYSKVSKLGHTAFKTGLLWTEKFINMMVDLSLDSLGEGDINNTSWEKLSPELNKKIVLFAGVLKELSENPATREAVKEIAQAITITMLEIMEEIKPELDKITDEALEMLDEMATKSVRGATGTAISIAQAFIAEIPWVGGIIDFMLAMGKGFNALMETYKVFVYRSSDMGVRGAKTYVKTEGTIEKGKERIEGAYDGAMDKIKESQDRVVTPTLLKPKDDDKDEGKVKDEVKGKDEGKDETKDKVKDETKDEGKDKDKDETKDEDNPWIEKKTIKGDKYWLNKDTKAVTKTPPPNLPKSVEVSNTNKTPDTMKGGKNRFIPNKNIGRKIIKGGKRLHKTMKLFHKTLPRIKFTHRNKIYKHHKHRKSRRNKKKFTRKL